MHRRCSNLKPSMCALGQKQTYAVQRAMSALPPKADMCGATTDVRFGPKADVAMQERMSAMNGSADQSLGAHRDRKLKERAVWLASCGPQASTVGFYDRTGDR